ncbi:hypothetical protein V1478_010559 [Vespula squamosa]|uniref:Uncharacterized protein n=1 Tax=Vespula squamosa TaxID=30214 RepID=A0ABD2AI50_VESSQ
MMFQMKNCIYTKSDIVSRSGYK